MESTRFVIEVFAGVIPGRPEEEFSRRWAVSSSEWEKAVAEATHGELLATTSGKAAGYAGMLQLMPERLNWVRTEWTWF